MSALFAVAAIICGVWAYFAYEESGHLNGRQYYEACWELRKQSAGYKEPMPTTPYQLATWKKCEPIVKRVMFSNGLIFSGTETGSEADLMRRACPNAFSEVPVGGLFYMFIQDTEAAGGVDTIAGYLPASFAISSWIKGRWPRCSAERERQGYPKIVEKADGSFGWEKPCPKCK